MNGEKHIIIAAEGVLDCEVLAKLCSLSGRRYIIDLQFNAHGFGRLKAGMTKFHAASYRIPHIILTDLDRHLCPPSLIAEWSVNKAHPKLLFNVAVREVEAWLLADREGIAAFLQVSPSRIPQDPENETDPKQTLINCARKSKKRRFSDEIVPALGSSASIGPLYNIHMINFVNTRWNIENAANHAPSLSRIIARLSTFLS